MKKLIQVIAVIFLLSMTCSLVIMSSQAQTTTNGLVGYWKLDEGSGNIAFDSSGNGNNGVMMSGASWVNGQSGTGIYLNGNSQYVMIPDSSSLDLQSFTLSVWVNMAERPYMHGSRHSCLINKFYFQIMGTGTKGWNFEFLDPTATNDNLVIQIGDNAAARTLIQYNSINDLTLNQWHYVVGTWDGSQVCIYIDGQLKTSSTPGAYSIVNDDTAIALGTETTSGAKDIWFKGKMDEVMIFNRSLSAVEIASLYSTLLATPTPSPTPSPSPTLSPSPSPTQTSVSPSPTILQSTQQPNIFTLWGNNIIGYFIAGALIAIVVLLILILLKKKN